MSQDLATKLKKSSLLKAGKMVDGKTPRVIIEQLSKQIARCDEASRRIEEEGIVVRDMKGSVIAHPAIKIEIAAGKIIADLVRMYGRSGVIEL